MRIDSQAEAKRALHHHHGQGKHPFDKPTMAHADHGDKHITGVGMDGIEVTPEMLMQADRDLAAAQIELGSHRTRATELHGPLGDGHGPVSTAMRSAFLDRASLDGGGVQAALQNYIDELQNVRDAINQTLLTYESVDSSVAEYLAQQSGEQA